jgi:hypothetical protein
MKTRTRGDSWRLREQGNDTGVENIVRADERNSAASKTALNNSSRCSLSPYLLKTNSNEIRSAAVENGRQIGYHDT